MPARVLHRLFTVLFFFLTWKHILSYVKQIANRNFLFAAAAAAAKLLSRVRLYATP